MAHYFDDVFTRNTGPLKQKKPQMRRSSTSRSMGQRSDFESSINGDDDAASIGNSVETETEDSRRERQEADVHTAHYVSEQLQMVRSNESAHTERGDEFEAQLDEH